jgi:hypothetical protein
VQVQVRVQCHRLEVFTTIRGSAPARAALPGDDLDIADTLAAFFDKGRDADFVRMPHVVIGAKGNQYRDKQLSLVFSETHQF